MYPPSNGSNGNGNGNGKANGHHNGHLEGLGEPRKPLINIDAEQGVLGAMFLENDTIDKVREILRPEYFFRDAHQIIYRLVLWLRDEGKPVDLILMAEELKRRGVLESIGGQDYLVQLGQCVNHAANVEWHAEIVRKKAVDRDLILASDEAKEAIYRQDTPTGEIVNRIADRLARIEILPEDDEDIEIRGWPDPPEDAAFHGLAGDLVRLIAPHSETDPVAILGQFFAAWGNLIGRGPHWSVERTPHYTNLFVALVGSTSQARKGTSWDHVKWIMHGCDPGWTDSRIVRGMASGEGFIWTVRDPVICRVKLKSGPFKGMYEDQEIDPGERDKRALWVETEFGATLAVMNREGNSLSGKVREAFDSGDMRSTTKNSPLRATHAHISIIAHITNEELQLRLTRNDLANGYANRFLWIAARRSGYLPHGGRIQDVVFTEIMRDLRHATENARLPLYLQPLERDDQADELWESVYRDLTSAKPGLLGAVTARAAPLTLRLAVIYALLDRSTTIERVHLEAALAFWRYCERSARYIFGDALGNPDADKLLKALVAAGESGLTLTQIRQRVFRGKKNAAETAAILGLLARSGLVQKIESAVPTGGRIAVSWRAQL